MKNRFALLKAKKQLLEKSIEEKQEELKEAKNKYEKLLKARFIISEVLKQIQDRLKLRIESLLTMAVKSVFDEDYRIEVIFDRTRNQLGCEIALFEGEEKRDWEEDLGGGLLPIVTFAFRTVLRSLEKPQSRPIVILDEPIKGSLGKDGDMISKAANIFKTISEKLKLQLIIFTHDSVFVDIGNKVFFVEKQNGISQVSITKEEKKTKKIRKLKRK